MMGFIMHLNIIIWFNLLNSISPSQIYIFYLFVYIDILYNKCINYWIIWLDLRGGDFLWSQVFLTICWIYSSLHPPQVNTACCWSIRLLCLVFSFFLVVQNLSSLFHSVCFLIPFYWLKASLPLFYPWLDYYSQNFILSAFLSDLTAIRFLYHCFAFLRSSLIWNKCRRKETSCNELNEIS